MKVICFTNLDIREDWPDELPAIPRVGDEIESMRHWNHFRLSLKVVAVRWRFNGVGYDPHIELHTDKSIRQFYEWYAPLIGKQVSAFI